MYDSLLLLEGGTSQELAQVLDTLDTEELVYLEALSQLEPDGTALFYWRPDAGKVVQVYAEDRNAKTLAWTVEEVDPDQVIDDVRDGLLEADLPAFIDPQQRAQGWHAAAFQDLYTLEMALYQSGLANPTAPAADRAELARAMDERVQGDIRALEGELARMKGLRAHHIATVYGTTSDAAIEASRDLGIPALEILAMVKDHTALMESGTEQGALLDAAWCAENSGGA